jgi:DNA-directed RNA polymerase specialized sigma24 family protein
MRAEEQFDSFYLKTRRALVHQAFALTGDLPAAQRAVRDSYVAAWHHWRKVSAHADRRDWVRPRAWALAQRRHTARLWQRTKGVPDRDRAVLDALHHLGSAERRALLLSTLAGVPHDVAARELGQPVATFERHLATALDRFPDQTGTEDVAAALLGLGGVVSGATLPRPAAIRREGRRRRRTHSAVAVAAAVFIAVGSGAVAHEPPPVTPAPEQSEAAPQSAPEPTETSTEPALPSADNLLVRRDLGRLSRDARWRDARTHDNTTGKGLNYVCQQERFADTEGLSTLVRTFRAGRGGFRAVVQTMEISASGAEAARGYDEVIAWFEQCAAERVHLVATYQVTGVGDEAAMVQLRPWRRPSVSYTAAVARADQVVSTVVVSTRGGQVVRPSQIRDLLADAIAKICPDGATEPCVRRRPGHREVAPGPADGPRGMLASLDLPPVPAVARPWVGTEPRAARPNPAATTCDRSRFAGPDTIRTATRTFLLTPARLPERFGLTQTLGVFRSGRQARAFVAAVRDRVSRCEDRDLAAEVRDLRTRRVGPFEVLSWRLEIALSEARDVQFEVGFVRRGAAVTQVTFVPAGRATLPPGAFDRLLVRAGQRLRQLD